MAARIRLPLHPGAGKIYGNGGYDNEFNLAAAEILAGKTESEYIPLSATIDIMGILDECRRQLGLVYPFELSVSY